MLEPFDLDSKGSEFDTKKNFSETELVKPLFTLSPLEQII
jgi:hypothetical protein